MNELQKRAFKTSLIFSILYVGLATVTVLSVYPSSPLSGDWVVIGILATFPISIISFGAMYADSHAQKTVLYIQIVVFFVTWLLVYKYLTKKYENERIE
ncbi:hypothetical protein [Spirosoma jeollabukense]